MWLRVDTAPRRRPRKWSIEHRDAILCSCGGGFFNISIPHVPRHFPSITNCPSTTSGIGIGFSLRRLTVSLSNLPQPSILWCLLPLTADLGVLGTRSSSFPGRSSLSYPIEDLPVQGSIIQEDVASNSLLSRLSGHITYDTEH